jgi:hypothetical protein
MRHVDDRTAQSLLRLCQLMKKDGSLPADQPFINIFPESVRAQILNVLSRPEFAKQLASLEAPSSTDPVVLDKITVVDVTLSLDGSQQHQQDGGASVISVSSIAEMKELQHVSIVVSDRVVESVTDEEMNF